MNANGKSPKVFILDVDGVMTSGAFFYTAEGKQLKQFGPDDNDALSLLSRCLEIRFVTGDRTGFAISERRIVTDMGFELDLVSTIRRADWIKERYRFDEVVYMGDGIFDHLVMKKVAYSIAPNNGDENACNTADFVTKRNGGDRAVAEACLHLMRTFFVPFDPNNLPADGTKFSGEWAA